MYLCENSKGCGISPESEARVKERIKFSSVFLDTAFEGSHDKPVIALHFP